MDGYIKINKKMLDWEWYRNINTFRLFMHILLIANWKDGRFEGHEVKRGSFVSSIFKLSFQTGLTIKQVRTALAHLKKTGELTVESYARFSIFSITNYNKYQEFTSQPDSQKEELKEKEVAAAKPDIPDGSKENAQDSESLKKKTAELEAVKEKINNSISGQMCQVRRFEEFWANYPKKNARFLAEQAYADLLLTTNVTEEELLISVRNYADSCKILARKEEYIKNPQNWLKDSTWIDYTAENYKKPQAKTFYNNTNYNNTKIENQKTENRFNNFEGRQYKMDDLERRLLGIGG